MVCDRSYAETVHCLLRIVPVYVASNDFMGPLIYVNTVSKYPVSIFLRMSMDADVGFEWNRVLAMSLIAIIPSLIVFFAAQDSFVEGIAAGGVKG